jgi:hypothetical protein
VLVNWDEGIFTALINHNRAVRPYACDAQALLTRSFDAPADLGLGCGHAFGHFARPTMPEGQWTNAITKTGLVIASSLAIKLLKAIGW